jgi:hypothetical protein
MQNAWRFIDDDIGERLKEVKGIGTPATVPGVAARRRKRRQGAFAAAAAQPRDRATAGSQD